MIRRVRGGGFRTVATCSLIATISSSGGGVEVEPAAGVAPDEAARASRVVKPSADDASPASCWRLASGATRRWVTQPPGKV